MSWVTIAQKPTTLWTETDHYVHYNGKVYCFGNYFGFPDATPNTFVARNVLEIYDIATGVWSTSPNPIPSSDGDTAWFLDKISTVAVHGSYIYLFGCEEERRSPTAARSTHRVLRYDPATDTYTQMTDVPATSPRSFYWNARAFTIGDAIYVVSRQLDFTTGTGQMRRYYPLTDTWDTPWTPNGYDTFKVDLASYAYLNTPCCHNGIIYFLSGYENPHCYAYNPAADAWTQIADLPDYSGQFALWFVNGTVTSVTDRQTFIDTGRDEIEDVFAHGVLTWLTGANAGYKMEIRSYNTATGEFILFLKMPYDVQIGDTYQAKWGCDKSLAMCNSRYSNVVNFRGEPFIPGPDKLLEYKAPQ